jgi:hypothetical protein
VKDPFALLSVEAIANVTGALPVLIYRHPGAVLASYRRMGWKPDIEEVERVAPECGRFDAESVSDDDVDQMGWFWAVCHAIALEQLARLPMAIVVSHQELSLGGPPAVRTLFDACDLAWSPRVAAEVARWSGPMATAPVSGDRLHVMNRAPKDVDESWRGRLDPGDILRLEQRTLRVLNELEERRLPLRG